MSGRRKRRRLNSSDSPQDSGSEKLIETFNRVEPLLCDLLTASRFVTDLDAVIGEQRAKFIAALRSLIWVNEEIPSSPSLKRILTEKSATSLGKRPAAPAPAPALAEAEYLPEPAAPLSTKTILSPILSPILPPLSPPSWPPQLPQIKDARIRQDALRPGFSAHNFQRMEFLGDAYLQMVSTHILYDRFPGSREGPLSDMRAKLVANIPLFEYARLYNFNSLIPGSPTWKMLADSFEAYVAGVVLSDPGDGIQKLKEWLEALYEPKMQEMARNLKPPKPQFAVKSSAKSRRPVIWIPRVTRAALRRPPVRISNPQPPPGEDEWEEWGDAMMVDEPEIQNPLASRVDNGVQNELQSLISGNGASVTYVPLETGGDGFEVMAVLTGWGFVDQPIGQGWGVNEE